ncbi:MAG: hypothetical protein GXY52_02505 [Chloroflexi bacterium]|nr:hypothetical protein [Chloroflexota bacterium]
MRWYDSYPALLAHEKPAFVDLGLPTDVHAKAAIAFLTAACRCCAKNPCRFRLPIATP